MGAEEKDREADEGQALNQTGRVRICHLRYHREGDRWYQGLLLQRHGDQVPLCHDPSLQTPLKQEHEGVLRTIPEALPGRDPYLEDGQWLGEPGRLPLVSHKGRYPPRLLLSPVPKDQRIH